MEKTIQLKVSVDVNDLTFTGKFVRNNKGEVIAEVKLDKPNIKVERITDANS